LTFCDVCSFMLCIACMMNRNTSQIRNRNRIWRLLSFHFCALFDIILLTFFVHMWHSLLGGVESLQILKLWWRGICWAASLQQLVFEEWNCLVEHFYSQSKWRLDIVTGTQSVTSKRSPGLTVYYEEWKSAIFGRESRELSIGTMLFSHSLLKTKNCLHIYVVNDVEIWLTSC
jgi:hypothetical protein